MILNCVKVIVVLILLHILWLGCPGSSWMLLGLAWCPTETVAHQMVGSLGLEVLLQDQIELVCFICCIILPPRRYAL